MSTCYIAIKKQSGWYSLLMPIPMHNLFPCVSVQFGVLPLSHEYETNVTPYSGALLSCEEYLLVLPQNCIQRDDHIYVVYTHWYLDFLNRKYAGHDFSMLHSYTLGALRVLNSVKSNMFSRRKHIMKCIPYVLSSEHDYCAGEISVKDWYILFFRLHIHIYFDGVYSNFLNMYMYIFIGYAACEYMDDTWH